MGGFLDWFFAFMTTIIDGIWAIISGIGTGLFQLFNFGGYIALFKAHQNSFTVMDWIFAVIAFLFVLLIFIILFYLIFLACRKYIRFRRSIVSSEDLLEEVANLHRDIIRLTKEKERILALKIGNSGVDPKALDAIFDENEKPEQPEQAEEAKAEEVQEEEKPEIPSRFARLSAVDAQFTYYTPPEYQNDITLEQLCTNFRNFACSRMGLFYDIRTIRMMFAGLSSTKLILLQGISGTGKTSLPYAMGKFFSKDATIVSVQPSWRDRTELFGYFNEFSKKFNETELLRRIYAASFDDDVNMIILDEMNIARVEYYFAEMLSVMEMPNPDEWRIELVPSTWDNDPAHLKDGRLLIPQNTWYVGTANNDDSTFSVSDKVYDRAFTINIDSKGVAFDAPDTPPVQVSYSHIAQLYQQAQEEHPMDQRYMDLIEELDNYVIKKFRVAFGNRIIKQLKIFVPVYVACGGDPVDAIDHILNTKVFRKFESLNLSLIREELRGLVNYLNTLFGKNKMAESIEYLERLYRTY